MPTKTLILATRNSGKVREFQTLLGPLGYDVITAAQAGYDAEPEETGTTFRANAEIKARAVFEGTGGKHAVLSDDSGLAVDALGGAPGVYSARYAGQDGNGADAANNAKLLREMARFERLGDRTGRYQIALCFIEPGSDDSAGIASSRGSVTEPVFFEAACEGVIGFDEKGGGGFGYDVLFLPTGEGGKPLDGRTFAEMSAEEKHPLSHRGKAVAGFVDFLRRSNT